MSALSVIILLFFIRPSPSRSFLDTIFFGSGRFGAARSHESIGAHPLFSVRSHTRNDRLSFNCSSGMSSSIMLLAIAALVSDGDMNRVALNLSGRRPKGLNLRCMILRAFLRLAGAWPASFHCCHLSVQIRSYLRFDMPAITVPPSKPHTAEERQAHDRSPPGPDGCLQRH